MELHHFIVSEIRPKSKKVRFEKDSPHSKLFIVYAYEVECLEFSTEPSFILSHSGESNLLSNVSSDSVKNGK